MAIAYRPESGSLVGPGFFLASVKVDARGSASKQGSVVRAFVAGRYTAFTTNLGGRPQEFDIKTVHVTVGFTIRW